MATHTKPTGQTINDRINAAKYTLAGQSLARCVCKATTEEPIGPKRKHLVELLACTHDTSVSIAQMANLLIERANNLSWIVVYKALITVHHLMSFGNERFIQYFASSNYLFQHKGFLDRTLGGHGYAMSPFVRLYSNYINAKALSYRKLAFDATRIERGPENIMRTMSIERLIKTLPVIQSQMDSLLEFDCVSEDLSNGVIVASFMLLFRDLVKLFATYNDGIINLLEKYFTLNKKLCRPAFEIYQKFTIRLDKVSQFLRVAESVGINRGEIPDLKKAPTSLLDALENHLDYLECKGKEPARSPSLKTSVSLGKPWGDNEKDTCVTDWTSITETSAWTSTNLENSEAVREALEEEARVMKQAITSQVDSLDLDGASKLSHSSDASQQRCSKLTGDEQQRYRSKSSNPFMSIGIDSDIGNLNQKEFDAFNLSISAITDMKVDSTKSNMDDDFDFPDPRADEEFVENFGTGFECSETKDTESKDPFGFVAQSSRTSIQSQTKARITSSPNDDLKVNGSGFNPFKAGGNNNNDNHFVELNAVTPYLPPGYEPGQSLLKPVPISRPHIDPSIDLHTQQQLQQIKHEQQAAAVSNRDQKNASPSNSNQPKSAKIKTAFEDLELVMRQSMISSAKSTTATN